jgi:hypothetical protein
VAAKKTGKPCQYPHEACGAAAIPGERFCPLHRGYMLREMAETGYLEPLPRERKTTVRIRADEWETGRACDLE